MELRNFDIVQYLSMKGIPISTQGKNVSPGWIGIKCLWCSDKSNHLGINLHSKAIKCLKCKKKGNAIQVVQKLEHCSWADAEKISENFLEYLIKTPEKIWVPKVKPEDVLPKEAVEEPLQIHLDYLEKRNFNPSEIIRKYKIRFTHHRGRLKFRIVIPIIVDRRVVGFTARDVTEKAELRYISSRNEEYLVNPDTILYNFDNVTDTAFVVEGPTDAWRLDAIGTLGTEFNEYHVNQFLVRKIQKAFIIFDPEKEAQKLAQKMASMLSVVVPHVELITLEEVEDPGALTPEQALELKRNLIS